jgi:dTDP-4-dehydrorhamnose 3,5-epimerase-like enzyme
MAAGELLGGRVTVLDTSSYADTRGILTALEFGPLAFQPVRVFVVEAPDGAVRGGHGHRQGRQLLLRLSGAIDIELRHADEVEHLRLDGESRAVLITAPVWSRQTYRGENPSLLVLSDTAFDPAAYLGEPVR